MKLLSRLRDPRYFQVAVLASLLAVGIGLLDFGIRWQNAVAIMLTAQLTQYAGSRLAGLPRFDDHVVIIDPALAH
jgi:hypothetical protein